MESTDMFCVEDEEDMNGFRLSVDQDARRGELTRVRIVVNVWTIGIQ